MVNLKHKTPPASRNTQVVLKTHHRGRVWSDGGLGSTPFILAVGPFWIFRYAPFNRVHLSCVYKCSCFSKSWLYCSTCIKHEEAEGREREREPGKTSRCSPWRVRSAVILVCRNTAPAANIKVNRECFACTADVTGDILIAACRRWKTWDLKKHGFSGAFSRKSEYSILPGWKVTAMFFMLRVCALFYFFYINHAVKTGLKNPDLINLLAAWLKRKKKSCRLFVIVSLLLLGLGENLHLVSLEMSDNMPRLILLWY